MITTEPTARGKTLPRRLTHATVSNWRNFKSAKIPLQRRVFLVGPNAAGKSNLLDLFRFLSDIVAVGGGFQEAVRKRGGVSSLRSLSARQYSDISIRIAVGSDVEPEAFVYELSFSQDNLRRPVLRKEVVFRAGRVILKRPDERDKEDSERLTQTYLEQVNANQDFRDLADFFRSIRYMHIVPQLVREPDRSVGKRNDPFGGDFLEQVARTQSRTRDARLRKIKDALSIAVPQLKELELKQDDRGLWHLRGRYEHWRPNAGWQSEADFSDGTLRLLGLLWAILDGSGPLLLEEPELSLHPEVVRLIPQIFAQVQRRTSRQILTSTHSSDLLDDKGIGIDEVLVLVPGKEGTEVRVVKDDETAKALIAEGVALGEAILPWTRPTRLSQFLLFDL
jgi:predicted ATPase